MPARILVYLIEPRPPKQPNFHMRWKEAGSRRSHERSTGTNVRRKAERIAARWEAEVNEGLWRPDENVPWEWFVDQYTENHLQDLADKTQTKALGVLTAFLRAVAPTHVSDVTTHSIAQFRQSLRDGKKSPSTIASNIAHLKAAIRWAHEHDMIASLPKFPRIPRTKSSEKVMRGRPVSQAEFDRMIKAAGQVFTAKHVEQWRRYMRGLWVSGLRLEESIDLYWDRDDKLLVWHDGEDWLLAIPGDSEKGGKNRLMPVVPEFADFLEETPAAERRGAVFTFPKRKVFVTKNGHLTRADWVSKQISKVGKEAEVIVDQKSQKYASAHDFRRSFGERWAARVEAPQLMELMRHESIETTMKYYVGRDAKRTARQLREIVTREKLGGAMGGAEPNEIEENDVSD